MIGEMWWFMNMGWSMGSFWVNTIPIHLYVPLFHLSKQGTRPFRLRAVSLFPWSVEQNARDTQMTTRVTEGAGRKRHEIFLLEFFLLGLPPSFLVSHGLAAQHSRARALPLLNLKKKRDCSQSTARWVKKRKLKMYLQHFNRKCSWFV